MGGHSADSRRPAASRRGTESHMETHTRSQTPHFMSYSHGYVMDITTSGIFFNKMSYPCHIHVISDFQKRYIWIDLVYPKLKKLHLVYTWYIFSCHMPCLSMSYPCHKFVRLSCVSLSGCPAIKIRPVYPVITMSYTMDILKY